MNKYQEALNELKSWSTTSSIPIGADKHFVYDQAHRLQELVDIYPEYLELKERATTKKINTSAIEVDDNSRAWAKVLDIDGFCPSCDYQVSKKENYCRVCGQALDRGEDNG